MREPVRLSMPSRNGKSTKGAASQPSTTKLAAQVASVASSVAKLTAAITVKPGVASAKRLGDKPGGAGNAAQPRGGFSPRLDHGEMHDAAYAKLMADHGHAKALPAPVGNSDSPATRAVGFTEPAEFVFSLTVGECAFVCPSLVPGIAAHVQTFALSDTATGLRNSSQSGSVSAFPSATSTPTTKCGVVPSASNGLSSLGGSFAAGLAHQFQSVGGHMAVEVATSANTTATIGALGADEGMPYFGRAVVKDEAYLISGTHNGDAWRLYQADSTLNVANGVVRSTIPTKLVPAAAKATAVVGIAPTQKGWQVAPNITVGSTFASIVGDGGFPIFPDDSLAGPMTQGQGVILVSAYGTAGATLTVKLTVRKSYYVQLEATHTHLIPGSHRTIPRAPLSRAYLCGHGAVAGNESSALVIANQKAAVKMAHGGVPEHEIRAVVNARPVPNADQQMTATMVPHTSMSLMDRIRSGLSSFGNAAEAFGEAVVKGGVAVANTVQSYRGVRAVIGAGRTASRVVPIVEEGAGALALLA